MLYLPQLPPLLNSCLHSKILSAIARKMSVAPLVNFGQLAAKTEGFSGADLQALLYNAHLDVIHSQRPSTRGTKQVDDEPIDYITFGNTPNEPALSKAEEVALQRRVSPRWMCLLTLSE